MMILHKISLSPTSSSNLHECLRLCRSGHSILLTGNGVYGAMQNSSVSKQLQIALSNIKIYALEEDIIARGIALSLMPGIELITYNEFVDLTIEHSKTCSWD
ncbi:MAG: sulfurtransferase complex subunit TusB [Gammaproteobacteria bacterium]|nr:sulfurtransferase complex subunit TusB [Gammaproteobacteria bacterium]